MLKADFLVLHYKCMDILFTRDVFYASTYRKLCNEQTMNNVSKVYFGPHLIPDFDIDTYIRKLFPDAVGGPPLLGAVCRTETIFTLPGNVNLTKPDLLNGEDLFSLAIPSDSEVRSYKLSEFRPLPYNIRSRVEKRGMLAIRFENALIQYFCDARVFISACIDAQVQRS